MSYQSLSDEQTTDKETSPLLPQLLHPKTTPDFYRSICDKLIEDCEDMDGLDIYQITAFLRFYKDDKYESNHLYHRCKYIFYCFKSIICALIQTIGMIAFIYNIFNTEQPELECTTTGASIELRILAVLFSMYISVTFVGSMKNMFNTTLDRSNNILIEQTCL